MNPRNWSLRARLTALVVALLAVVSVAIGLLAFVTIRSTLTENFDGQVQEATQRAMRQLEGNPIDGGIGVDAGTIIIYTSGSGTLVGKYVKAVSGATNEVALRTLTSSQVAAVTAAEFRSSGICSFATVDVPGYGDYRFCSTFGAQAAIGLPLSKLEQQIATQLTVLGGIVLMAIVLAGVLAGFVIQRSLRPLRRVAAVASAVAGMPLDRGDVNLQTRVPPEDTNPHTEAGQVGAALNNLLESVGTALAVRQASEEKVRHFVADASHELRTPLASIRGYAELTRRYGEVDERSAHNVERIESEAKRMTSLVEDLLLLARLDAQRELEVVEVDLSRLLVDVVSDAHAASRDHVWDLDVPEEPVTVRGDAAKLQQVFVNLLANARVHTPPGTTVTVALEPANADRVVAVRVADTGPGVPESIMPTLFERFVRADASRNRTTGSTGLGLSIVAAVVQAHGGAVEVESAPGNTVFTVLLPEEGPR